MQPHKTASKKSSGKRQLSRQHGFAAMYLTVLVLAITLSIGISISLLIVRGQQIRQNIVQSAQAYYAAEAGIEDALLRLRTSRSWTSLYTFEVQNASSTVTISPLVGGTRTITAEGDRSNRIRKIRAIYQINTTGVSFNFGAQVGDGGLQMESNSSIVGNVFSNSDISGAGAGGSISTITGTAQVAGPGNELSNTAVGGDAFVDLCEDSPIDGELHGGSHTGCTFASFISESPPSPVPLPISDAQIAAWKAEAEAGGVITPGPPDFEHRISGTVSLGPKKIDGNLRISTGATLIVTGTLWVTGELRPDSNANIILDSGYGPLSGVFIADDTIRLESNILVCGSEGMDLSPRRCNPSAGSFIMFLSTDSSLDSDNPAIRIDSEVDAAIAYASAGLIDIRSNSELKEVTGYAVRIRSNADIVYDSGLADVNFTSGPAGGWSIPSWREVE